jgi:hypothetical protein
VRPSSDPPRQADVDLVFICVGPIGCDTCSPDLSAGRCPRPFPGSDENTTRAVLPRAHRGCPGHLRRSDGLRCHDLLRSPIAGRATATREQDQREHEAGKGPHRRDDAIRRPVRSPVDPSEPSSARYAAPITWPSARTTRPSAACRSKRPPPRHPRKICSTTAPVTDTGVRPERVRRRGRARAGPGAQGGDRGRGREASDGGPPLP